MSEEDQIGESASAGGDEGLDAWGDAMEEQLGSGVDEPAEAAAAFDTLQQNGVDAEVSDRNLETILDIPVTLSMELGRTKMTINNLLKLNQGSVVELERLAGEPLDVLVNGCMVAHGEVVVVNDRFGVRLTDVLSPKERVKTLA